MTAKKQYRLYTSKLSIGVDDLAYLKPKDGEEGIILISRFVHSNSPSRVIYRQGQGCRTDTGGIVLEAPRGLR